MFTLCSKVMVPYDGSEPSKKALAEAISLVKQDQRIQLEVVMVFELPTSAAFYYAYDLNSFKEAQLSAAKEVLDPVTETLESIPNTTKTILLEGAPATIIVDYIQQNGVDLAIMGSRGLSGIKELFLGSVSHYVVQKSTCPVLIVK